MSRSVCHPPLDSLDDPRWSTIWAHHDELLSFARRRVLSDSDAEDVVHEAMALAAADPNIELHRVGAWLNRVVRNRCADLARERSYADKRVIYEHGRARVQTSTEDLVCDNAEARFLAEMLQTLPSRQHEALMHASDGLSNAQIANVMRTTVKAIERLLVKARRTLRLAAAAVITGLAFLARRSPRSATSSAGLVALSVGLSVFSLITPAPAEQRTAPRLALRPEVVTVGLPTGTVHTSATTTQKQQIFLHKRPPVSVRVKPHDHSIEVKAGPTDTTVSGHRYGPITNPVPDAKACLRGGVIVSQHYIGCRISPGNN